MAERPSRLGRGLAALLGEGTASLSMAGPLVRLPLAAIRPNPGQPRRRIAEEALEALAQSIRTSGLVQPVVVRALDDGHYELIAGERRWRAAERAGLEEIPALLRDADERERLELALVENMVREDLNPLEVARACALLIEDFGQTHAEVGARLGRSRPAISNLLRLLELPDDVQDMVHDGLLSEGHARAVLMVEGAGARRRLAEAVVAGGLSVREAERRARGGATPAPRPAPAAPENADRALDAFAGALGASARVRARRDGSVAVELRFESAEALDAAIRRLDGLGPSPSLAAHEGADGRDPSGPAVLRT